MYTVLRTNTSYKLRSKVVQAKSIFIKHETLGLGRKILKSNKGKRWPGALTTNTK
jgi:hypothetical protein